ncbi:MAG TPA: HD domain-containing protein [Gaiellaceae bacterium]
MPSATPNPLLLDALATAVAAHGTAKQARKGTGFPYAIHPIRVAETLHFAGCDDEVVAAGFLHDTTEDTAVSLQEIEARFGPRVARLVAGASEPDKSAPWKARKQHTLDFLRRDADHDTLMVTAADKLDNVRAIHALLRRHGADEAWSAFNAPVSEQEWYYRGVAGALLGREPDNPLFLRLDAEVKTVFPG